MRNDQQAMIHTKVDGRSVSIVVAAMLFATAICGQRADASVLSTKNRPPWPGGRPPRVCGADLAWRRQRLSRRRDQADLAALFVQPQPRCGDSLVVDRRGNLFLADSYSTWVFEYAPGTSTPSKSFSTSETPFPEHSLARLDALRIRGDGIGRPCRCSRLRARKHEGYSHVERFCNRLSPRHGSGRRGGRLRRVLGLGGQPIRHRRIRGRTDADGTSQPRRTLSTVVGRRSGRQSPRRCP